MDRKSFLKSLVSMAIPFLTARCTGPGIKGFSPAIENEQYFDDRLTPHRLIIGDSMVQNLPWPNWTMLAWGDHPIQEIAQNLKEETSEGRLPENNTQLVLWPGTAELKWLLYYAKEFLEKGAKGLESAAKEKPQSRSVYNSILKSNFEFSIESQAEIVVKHYLDFLNFIEAEIRVTDIVVDSLEFAKRKILIGPFPLCGKTPYRVDQEGKLEENPEYVTNADLVAVLNAKLNTIAHSLDYEFIPAAEYFYFDEMRAELPDPNFVYKKDPIHLTSASGMILYDILFATNVTEQKYMKKPYALHRFQEMQLMKEYLSQGSTISKEDFRNRLATLGVEYYTGV